MADTRPGPLAAFLRQPEPNLLLFGFLLNLPWELLQIPFFAGMSSLAHWDGVMLCTRAAAGDALISLVAFWMVASWRRSRTWLARTGWRECVAFVAPGLVATIAFEWWAIRVGRWAYAESMPAMPWLQTGLLPLLQWLLIPPLLLWIVRRQIR